MNFYLDITRLATPHFPQRPDRHRPCRIRLRQAHDRRSRHGLRVHRAGVFRRDPPRTRPRHSAAGGARLAARRDGRRKIPSSPRCAGWLDSPLDSQASRPARFRAQKRWARVAARRRFLPAARHPARRDAARRAGSRATARRARDVLPLLARATRQARAVPLAGRDRACARPSSSTTPFPIEFPEFCSPGAFDRHIGRLATVSAHATLAIVNSQDSRRAVAAALAERRLRAPEIAVVPLAVDEAFVARPGRARRSGRRSPISSMSAPSSRARTCCSCWRSGGGWSSATAQRAPRLVIAGRRGWENENIVDVLERSRAARAVPRRGLRSHRRRAGAADGGFRGAGRALVHRRFRAAGRRDASRRARRRSSPTSPRIARSARITPCSPTPSTGRPGSARSRR